MNKKHILFVDDEPMILNGLRRMLHPLRTCWTMHFADSAAKALELLAEQEVAVVVSDMRMPGMNGFELLKIIFKQWPQVIRVMLTGQPDKDIYCEVMTVSHYFLWKPARFEDFRLLLDTIHDLDAALQDPNLTQLLGGIVALPSLPPLFHRLTDLIEHQQTTDAQIAAVLTEDAAMAAQILKLANSAYFAPTPHIETIEDAVSYLGLETLQQLVLTHHLFSQCSDAERAAYQLDQLWRHSLYTATLAKVIAATLSDDRVTQNNAYLAGLLHEIGKLVLIRHLPETYSAVLRQVQEQGLSQIEAESALIGSNHAVIGGYLTALWGLPRPIIEAVTMHRSTPVPSATCKISPVLEAVWHADRICHGDCSQSAQYQDVAEQWRHLHHT
jgi:HD-like signal output (HDOD) protein